MLGFGPLFDHIERIALLGSYRWAVGDETAEWSPGMFRLLGYQVGEVTPSPAAFFGRIHPDDMQRVQQALVQTLSDGKIGADTFRLRMPSGEVRFVRGRGDVVREEGDRVVVVGTIADVTEEVRAAATIQEAEALIDEMQQLTGVGHFVFTPAPDLLRQGQLRQSEPRLGRTQQGHVRWSSGLRRILGVSDSEDPSQEHGLTHADDVARERDWARAVLSGERPAPLHARVVRRDGTVRHIETRARLLESDGRGPRMVGTVIDTTDRVVLDERLRQLAKLEAIGTLAAGVAHDFNNYLTVVAGQLEVVRAGGAPDESIDAAVEAVRQCALLTKQLLAFSRQQALEARVVDVAQMLEQLLPLVRRSVGPRVTVVIEPPAQPLFVRVDPGQLESVVANLAVNARDAMPHGGTLTYSLELVEVGHERGSEGIHPGRYVRMSARDTGVGIPPEVLPRIFEPYFTTKPHGRGSGLGLASVYGTIRQHGGFIDVKTGQSGTTFNVNLPASERALERHSTPPTQERPGALTVLVVDDVASVRELAAWFLRAEGVRALTVADGVEALALLERERVDVVLTDVVMPRMGGVELARALAQRPDPPAVVFMTGYAERHEVEKLPGAVVQKPFDAEALRRAVGLVKPK